MSTAAVAVEPRSSRRGAAAAAGPRRSRGELLHAPSPWVSSHLTWCGALATIGVIGQIACWFGVSGEATLREQLPWVGGALLFAAVCVGAAVAWLGVGFATVRRAHRDVFAETRRTFGIAAPSARSVLSAGATAGDANAALVTSPTMTMVHRADCLAARGKDVRAVGAAEAERAGLSRCGICAP